jgi:hypothetical protein
MPDDIHGTDLFEIIRTTRSRTDPHDDWPSPGLYDLPDLSGRVAL